MDIETKERTTLFRITEELHDSGYCMLDQLDYGPIEQAQERHSHDVIQIYVDNDFSKCITIDVEMVDCKFYLRINTPKSHIVDHFSETCRIKV